MRASVRVEWDMGHRLPNHDGKCRSLHGHRYAAEITVDGPIIETNGAPDQGMVVDFGPLKEAIRRVIDDDYDHKTLLYELDPIAAAIPDGFGVIRVPYIPTAENIARFLWTELAAVIESLVPGSTVSMRLYETPTSWVEAGRH